MAKKKTKKQLEQEMFEEMKRRALEPFKPTLTREEMLRHKEELRERSMGNYHNLKEDISEGEMQNIKSRADFEHHF